MKIMFDNEEADLEVIVIRRPYDTYRTSTQTRKIISDLFKLKLDGYCSHYPYGILPISDYDFMGTHVCLAIKRKDDLFPVSAFKSISYQDCLDFDAPFPVINHKFGKYKDQFPEHVEALKSWEENLKKNNSKFAYNASWTMQSDLKGELRTAIRDVSYSLFYHYYTTEGIEHVINSTSCNYGVNKHQEAMGLKYLKDSSSQALPPFESPVFHNQPFYIMYLDQDGFSELFTRRSEKFSSIWKRRNVIEDLGVRRAIA